MSQLAERAAVATSPIPGLMQDYPLTVHHIFWRLENLFGPKVVVTRREHSVHQPGVELRIVDLGTGQPLPWDGQAFGEVHVRGPWIASGYHNGAGGEWISSVDLENAIMGHPKVAEAAVIGLSHALWQERPVAYVAPRAEHRADVSAAEIQDFLSTRVAKWWLPDEVRFIDVVPRTSVGKFDKKALRASAAPLAAADADAAAPV